MVKQRICKRKQNKCLLYRYESHAIRFRVYSWKKTDKNVVCAVVGGPISALQFFHLGASYNTYKRNIRWGPNLDVRSRLWHIASCFHLHFNNWSLHSVQTGRILQLFRCRCHTIKNIVYYRYFQKLAASLKPVRKWGPVDPILRYNWVHWHSKAKQGQRDFTLKRRGTKDYTHSVKKYSKPQPKSYNQTASELSGAVDILGNDKNQNNIRLSNGSSTYAEPYQENNGASYYHAQPQQLRVTSLVDSFEPVYGDLSTDGNRFVLYLNLALVTCFIQ